MNPETRPSCPLKVTAETLSAWRDDLLDASEAERISQHLRTCQACQQQERDFDRIAALLRRQRELDPGTQIWQGVRGRLRQQGVDPIQLYQRRNGPDTRPDFHPERGQRMKGISRAGQRWSARATVLAASVLLVVLIGGLTLGLILVHQTGTGKPGGPKNQATATVTTSPQQPRAFHEFTLPPPPPGFCMSINCGPGAITSGPDGNLWFSGSPQDLIGRITPTGTVEEFPLSTTCNNVLGCGPSAITSGPDGNLWFTEPGRNSIGRITPAGQFQLFALPTTCGATTGCVLGDITRGPDGNLWFTEQFGNSIGRITPAGKIEEFALPTTCGGSGCRPLDITRGPDGNLWFTEQFGNSIGRITPAGQFQEFALPTTCGSSGCSPSAITSGPDGNVWFTELFGNSIGRITPAGQFQEFTLPHCEPVTGNYCGPLAITSGPDGNLWFTSSGGLISRITPTGQIQEFTPPTVCGSNCTLGAITSGPDGNLWFTESGGDAIGEVSP